MCVILIATSGWISTRRRTRPSATTVRDPPPLPAMMNNEVLVQVQTENTTTEPTTHVSTESTTTEPSAHVQSESQRSTIDLTGESTPPPPSQSEPFKVACALSYTYMAFIRYNHEEKIMNNLGYGYSPSAGTLRHRKMMSKIDQHFADSASVRILDPEVAAYIQTADLAKVNNFDRLRLNIANIEIERNRYQIRKDRLARLRLRVPEKKRASCPVCLSQFEPKNGIVYPTCGHTLCSNCMTKIFEEEELEDACVSCRALIDDRSDVCNIYFQFNHQHEPICRFCEEPFQADPIDADSCQIIPCGHAFHKHCLYTSQMNCLACATFISGKAKQLFLHFQ